MKKSPYTRATRECSFFDLPPAFHRYLQIYAEEHGLENLEGSVEHCFITSNSKKKLLGGIKMDETVICIGSEFLFWGVIDEKKESGIGAALWTEISDVREWETSEMAAMVEDHGVELLGFRFRHSERCRWFIGLDQSTAGMHCRDLLKEKMRK